MSTMNKLLAGVSLLGFLAGAANAQQIQGLSGNSSTGLVCTGCTLTNPTINGTVSGTAVASAATANTLALRDANANIFFNNPLANSNSITAAGGTTILTVASAKIQILKTNGGNGQTYQLPDATTLSVLGPWFKFNNNSGGTLTVNNAGASSVYSIPVGGSTECSVLDNSTANGTWDCHSYVPNNASWGTGSTGLTMNTSLNTTPQISAGVASSTSPAFIPQRGSATTGYSGDSTHLYNIIGGTNIATVNATNFSVSSGLANSVTLAGSATNPIIGTTGGNLTLAPNSPTVIITGTNPTAMLNDPGGAADQKNYQVLSSSGVFTIRTANDAVGAATTAYQIARGTTYNVASHTWYTSTVAGTSVQGMQLTPTAFVIGDGTHTSFQVNAPAGTANVNYLNAIGEITGVSPILYANGSDTNVGFQFSTKGTGTFTFTTAGLGSPKTQFAIIDNASGADYITVTSGASAGSINTNAGGLTLGSNSGTTTISDATVNFVAATAANGSVATSLGSVGPVGSHTTVQAWLKVQVNGTTIYIPGF